MNMAWLKKCDFGHDDTNGHSVALCCNGDNANVASPSHQRPRDLA